MSSSDSPLENVAPHASDSSFGFERVTGWLSAACAIHCLLTPLAIAVLPLLGSSGGVALNGTAETVLNALVLGSGSLSLVLGFRRHRDLRLALVIAGCLLLYLVGHSAETTWYGALLSVVAGFGLAAASFWSARLGHLHSEHCAH